MANDSNSIALRDIDRVQKVAATRGVSYPFMSLPEALESARKIYNAERKTAAPVASAIEHLGYAESSSGGRQTISALLQFGLLEDQGRKDERLVKLTGIALDALLAEEGSEERKSALIECVKSPKIYRDIFAKWPDELPSDQTISYFLLRDKNFNPKAMQSFIKDLRASLIFVGVEHPRDLEGNGLAASDPNSQLTSSQSSIAQPRGMQLTPTAAPSAADLVEHYRPQVTLNEKEWMKGSLSKSTGFRILISGEIDAKQIGRLIKLLEAQKAVLDDDDDDEL
jgi:hypothetical protein